MAPPPGEVPRLAEGRPLNARERARLIAEILASYRQARKALRQTPIESAVQTLRGHPGPHDAHGDGNGDSDGSRVAQAAQTGVNGETRLLGEAHRLGRAVQRTLRLVPGDTRCLTRSLVLTQLLSRRGIPAKLVIGARATPSFLAHAWVECAGRPVLPAGDGSFGRLVEL